jgi:hypothetical protein
MFKIIENSNNLLYIKASGEVTAADYETVLIPAAEKILKEHDKLRMIYELGPDMTGFSAGAMWEDAKVGMDHLTQFEKLAVISDHPWIVNMVKVFAFMIPCPVKVFSVAEATEARSWI